MEIEKSEALERVIQEGDNAIKANELFLKEYISNMKESLQDNLMDNNLQDDVSLRIVYKLRVLNDISNDVDSKIIMSRTARQQLKVEK